jgi:hypothetical protein
MHAMSPSLGAHGGKGLGAASGTQNKSQTVKLSQYCVM